MGSRPSITVVFVFYHRIRLQALRKLGLRLPPPGRLIVPRLVPDLEILPWRRTHVIAVEVHPSLSRPHFLKREGLERGVYVRVGSTNRRADREVGTGPQDPKRRYFRSG